MKAYFLRVLIAFDQMVQAMLRYGIPGETISARAGKAARRGRRWGCWLCDFLNIINYDHCEKAIANDRARAQAVINDLS